MVSFSVRCLLIVVSLAGGLFPGVAGAREAGPPIAEIIAQRLDPGIKPEVRDLIINDFVQLTQQPMEVRPNSIFAHIFGSDSANGVIDYVLRRISYILPPTGSEMIEWQDGFKTKKKSFSSIDAFKAAANAIWFPFRLRVNQWRTGKQLRLGSIFVPSDSPVSGLISLGKYFSTSIDDFPDRIVTWIHEARHSDIDIELIKGLLKHADFGFWNKQLVMEDIKKLPRKTFLHDHVVCPPETGKKDKTDHESCDKDLWGAYTFTAVYLSEVSHSGKHLTAKQKQKEIKGACYYYGLVVPIVRQIGSALPALKSSSEEQQRYVDRAEEFLRTKLDQLDVTPTVNKATWDATVQAFQEFKRQREQHPEEFNASYNLAKP